MMNRWPVVKRLLPLLAGMALLLSACGREDLSALNPQGPVAQEQLGIMKLSITIMVLVVVVVFAIAIYVLFRFRRKPGDQTIPKQVEGNHKLEIIWTVIPLILLVILGVPTIQSVFGLAQDYSKDENAIQIKVTAHQYWWEFEYPDHGITTAQEMIIPTNAVISIEAQSADVIHSFWIPSLAGKIDTNPGGNVNNMYFEATKPGVYLGKCAELCGPSHAYMDFKVKAVDDASFERWVTAMKEPATLPEDAAIAETFTSQCLTCHAIGDKGLQGLYPNLTGMGSREAVAGFLLNTDDPKYKNEGSVYDNLVRWIKDPEAVKPGNQMPKVDLSDEEIEAIAKYLSEQKLDY
ncbi:cytochrome c oxidase subunit II [Paenibacillus sp. IB182496]|uniref:Cytochrome c oxidase subunit 2 n=1 Tax=Paenibacillus sabuli TaxID=2772509 RepID=A0A927BV30_9BACL|nr:cytochrome c oxidase subunit II [Paenibacillus sabuli]MBD2847378.1 cytochrome c oxidase subunit II [Paenibacillus sabuli]